MINQTQKPTQETRTENVSDLLRTLGVDTLTLATKNHGDEKAQPSIGHYVAILDFYCEHPESRLIYNQAVNKSYLYAKRKVFQHIGNLEASFGPKVLEVKEKISLLLNRKCEGAI